MSGTVKIIFCIAVTGAVLWAGIIISNQPTQVSANVEKINGVSLVAPARPIKKEALDPIKKLHANWIVVTPYAFSQAGQASVTFNYEHQWWGERTEGVARTIMYAKEAGLKVMLKPHVWVHGQGWTGDFSLRDESQWRKWEKDYSEYIIHFARLADSLNVGLLCIGTEYRKVADNRPDFWRTLIKKIHTVYAGKLTYAANWDNYKKISFWDQLDYIGIDAYFPLSGQKMPSVTHLKESWKPVKQKLKQFANAHSKPLVFTEFGYQSVDYTTDGHWKYKWGERASNMQAQSNAYQALFETFWHEPWFGGGFLWKWPVQKGRYHHRDEKSYTPRDKPAEDIVRHWYKENSSSR